MSIDGQVVIAVPGAPAIPGLIFRRFHGEADYPIMVAILNACDAADNLVYVSTVEEVAHVFALSVDTRNPYGTPRLYEGVGYHEPSRHTFFNKEMHPVPTNTALSFSPSR